MVFAYLFIAIVFLALLIYHFSRHWMLAVATPVVAFVVLSFVSDSGYSLIFLLSFGVPLVFLAALLGVFLRVNGVDWWKKKGADDDEHQSPF